ncbi:MAG: carbohydrate-binding domain-containing protein [Bacteroidales bacterium]|nr:carbohydrate-binding domain-containing protein [Bacteroidales bacterium]
MRKVALFIMVLLINGALFAQQEKMLIHHSSNVVYEKAISSIDSIKMNASIYNILINEANNITSIPISGIDSITFTNDTATNPISNVVYIIFNDTTCNIINPLSALGVTITDTANIVNIVTTANIENIEYYISGTTTNGSITINSDKKLVINLGGANITNPSGAAILVSSSKETKVILTANTENYLSDGSGSSAKAPLHCAGNIIFDGQGSLKLNSVKKHGISSSKAINILNGNIEVLYALSDGIHSEGFSMTNGSLKIDTTFGDGIDAGATDLIIDGGTINISSTADDVKGIKTDAVVIINGSDLTMTVAGAQSKGIKGTSRVIINNGNINVTTSGITVVESLDLGFDTKYATGITSDSNIVINGGTITMVNTSTNNGGKCLSADGSVYINGGTVNLTTNGNGDTITTSLGVKDDFSSSCIKGDYGVYLLGGNITCLSTGLGGKGISADSLIIIGTIGDADSNLILNVSTTGNRFYVEGLMLDTPDDSTNYCNPKAVKSDGDLYVNSGIVTILCTQTTDGGEGLESKDSLFINGGIIDINTFDDCVNAANHIQINGGKTYAYGRGNDGFDSNGTFWITGGFTISCGKHFPDEGFDCDLHNFKITGGILIGTGGATSDPTDSLCTQHSLKYSNATAGNAICIKNSNNEAIFTYTLPIYSADSTGSTGGPGGQVDLNSMLLLYSSPSLTAGSYTLQYGGTITGGTSFHNYYNGATYTGGSTKTFTITNMLTSVQ